MALTIVAQPPSIALANSPMLFDLHSADNAEAGHKYTLKVWIWNGTTASQPTDPTFTLTKSPNSAGKALFDVSRLVREKLEATKVSELVDTSTTTNADDDVYWVQGKASATWDAGSDAEVDGNTILGTLGYSMYSDGAINATLTGFPLQNKLKIHTSSKLMLPVFTSIADELVITDSASATKTFSFTANTNTSSRLKFCNVSPSKFSGYGIATSGTYTITYKLSSSVVHTAYLEVVCEKKYDPMQLMYLSSNGSWSFMTFFKASTKTLDAQRTTYYNSVVDYGSSSVAASYSTEQGMRTGYLSQGYMTHVLNTGYVDESEDVRIKQLLLSDSVVLYDGSKFIGVEVVSNSQVMQKHKNERVINYTISVKETAGEINKVY